MFLDIIHVPVFTKTPSYFYFKTQHFGNRDELYLLGSTEYVLPQDGDRIQSPKRCFK
jgi:hypothetical protein